MDPNEPVKSVKHLAETTGVASVRLTRAATRLGVGHRESVPLVASRRMLVLSDEEAELVLADIAERARQRIARDQAVLAAATSLTTK